MYVRLPLLILFGHFVCCRSACTYPSVLIGEWYSTSFGTLNFETNQSFSGFTSVLSATPLTFTCFASSGSQYVSMTSYPLVADITADVYLCMNLQQISSIKYYFTLDSNLASDIGVRFYTPDTSGQTVTLSQACSRSDPRSAGEYELLIKKDQISNALIACPSGLLSTFSVTMTTGSATSCTDTRMEGSTGALVFNYSSCATGRFSSGGYLQCLYSKANGYSYATLYNNDTTTDESSTYMFTCLTYEKYEETLRATESPGSCHLSQTPSSVTSPGVTYVMTDLLYTPKEKDYTTIIIVVCCIAGVIIIVIVVVILYFKVCRKHKPEQPPKIRKKKRKPSITEYTPRSLGRAASVEKLEEGVINKKSTGEILTGLNAEKKDKHVVLNGDAYEPPKKEAWQKKWEKDQHKTSPTLTQESLRRMKKLFSSDEGLSCQDELSVSDLDKAYTLSTSLPESIDLPTKQSPRQSTNSVGSNDALRNSVTPKYNERFHATPSIPASTGKFGSSPKITKEPVQLPKVETKLDTISENPLSRENTGILKKSSQANKIKEVPNLTRILSGGDVSALSTVLASRSTASVGDIRLQSSFQNIGSRISYLSASNASIFDDPGWLMENKEAPGGDDTFRRLKNLIPSIPKEKDRDPKWFMKTQKMPEISREDIDYYRSRNKSYVGLNSGAKQGSLNSLEIIAQEKMRRKHKKNKKDKPKLGWQYKWEEVMRPKKVKPENKHHIERSQTPVKLFQTIATEEPYCNSYVNKADDDQTKQEKDKTELSQDESNTQNKSEASEGDIEENKSKDGPTNDLLSINKDSITRSTNGMNNKSVIAFVDEKESQTSHFSPPSIKKTKNKHKEKHSRTKMSAKETEYHNVTFLYDQSTDSVESVHNESLKTDHIGNEIIDTTKGYSTDTSGTDISVTVYSVDTSAADYISARSDSIRTLEQVEYDSISLRSELFYPEDWIYGTCSSLDQVWKIGAKATSSKRKREYKNYIGADEDIIQRKEISSFKKEISPFKNKSISFKKRKRDN